jgi:hypothetical protein
VSLFLAQIEFAQELIYPGSVTTSRHTVSDRSLTGSACIRSDLIKRVRINLAQWFEDELLTARVGFPPIPQGLLHT